MKASMLAGAKVHNHRKSRKKKKEKKKTEV
jgi:hypothetical protein